MRRIDPHEFGWHSAACRSKAGCVLGIDISHARPWRLDTPAKVKEANRLKRRIGGRLIPREDWKLGDYCWYRPKAMK